MRKAFALLTAALLMAAMPLCAALGEGATTPQALLTGYLSPVAEPGEGSAGYSLKLAVATCKALAFAEEKALQDADMDALVESLDIAWDALGAARQLRFMENRNAVFAQADAAFEDYENEAPLYEDAGVDADMAKLIASETARAAWQALTEATSRMTTDVAPPEQGG